MTDIWMVTEYDDWDIDSPGYLVGGFATHEAAEAWVREVETMQLFDNEADDDEDSGAWDTKTWLITKSRMIG